MAHNTIALTTELRELNNLGYRVLFNNVSKFEFSHVPAKPSMTDDISYPARTRVRRITNPALEHDTPHPLYGRREIKCEQTFVAQLKSRADF